MKIGIYNEPAGGSIGGAEVMSAVMAEALKTSHQVEIVHHRRTLDVADLAQISGADLMGVQLRYVAPERELSEGIYNPGRRYRTARRWHAALSAPYDLFICLLHGLPPFCHAPQGFLFVLFPFFTLPYAGANRRPHAESLRARLRKRLVRLYYNWEWRKRMGGYERKAAISEFAREWSARRWGIECRVIHPPVCNQFRVVEKENLILSVGRFAVEGEGHAKNQLEMVETFREAANAGLRNWNYVSVGGLGESPRHREFFEKLRAASAGTGAQVSANLSRERLANFYERAKIFWHAAGLSAAEGERPELMEHFGISTVEAMAAGCVPVVINKGGQPEIVEHGVNGFLWNTLDELKHFTALLANDEPLRARMSEAARERAQFFSRENFVKRFTGLIGDG